MNTSDQNTSDETLPEIFTERDVLGQEKPLHKYPQSIQPHKLLAGILLFLFALILVYVIVLIV